MKRQMKIIKKVRMTVLLGIIVSIASLILFTRIRGFTGNKGPITIGVEQSPLLALIVIAEDRAFFSKQGVDVTVKHCASGKGARAPRVIGFATPWPRSFG
jgi:ABC-type nitrate/sulfonate/bicarbonate transport system substrate-binding protein